MAENLRYNIDISFSIMYNYIKNTEGRFMNIWHDISPERIKAEDFIAVIEISKGSKKKYELDK